MTKPLRILACAFTCCPPGYDGFTGGESLLGWQLIRQIARFNHIWVLTQDDDREYLVESLHGTVAESIHLVFIKMPRILRFLLKYQGCHQIYYYLWQIKAYRVAKKLNSEQQFDVFHQITYANDWMASFIGALLPIPYVRGPCGGAQRTPKGFLREYSIKGRIWERLRSFGQWVFRHDPFFILGQSKAKVILACNGEVLDALPPAVRSKAQLYSVCGVDPNDFLQYPVKRDNSIFRGVSAGKLIELKGLTIAIKSFSVFHSQHPDSSLTIIGDGPELNKLINEVSKCGAEKYIHFERWMPHKELIKEMGRSDVFLFPSFRDGGGTVVVEAMSMGTPVVCLDMCGPSLHVTSETGIKIIAETPEDAIVKFKEAMEKLYLDRELLKKMGSAGRERAISVYDWSKVGERLSSLYRDYVVDTNLDASK